MQITELILLLMWFAAGVFISLGCITNHPKLRIDVLFTIENRWGQLIFSLMILTFVIKRVVDWQLSNNPNIIWSF